MPVFSVFRSYDLCVSEGQGSQNYEVQRDEEHNGQRRRCSDSKARGLVSPPKRGAEAHSEPRDQAKCHYGSQGQKRSLRDVKGEIIGRQNSCDQRN